jgi:hypothetical protein
MMLIKKELKVMSIRKIKKNKIVINMVDLECYRFSQLKFWGFGRFVFIMIFFYENNLRLFWYLEMNWFLYFLNLKWRIVKAKLDFYLSLYI